MPSGVSRRGLLWGAGGTLAVAGAGVGGFAAGRSGADAAGAAQPAPGASYAFYGAHQAGIATPAQDRLHFAAFDVTTTVKAELVGLLRDWTEAAAEMTRGVPVGGGRASPTTRRPTTRARRSGCRRPA